MYATDAIIERVVDDVDNMRQREDETERQFADRLRKKARSCGPVYSEGDLITRFLRGLSPDLKPLLRVQRHDLRGPRAFYDFVERATAAGEAHRPLLARYAKRPKDAPKSAKVFAVETATQSSPNSGHSRRKSSNGRRAKEPDPVLVTERHADIESESSSEGDTVTEFESSGIVQADEQDVVAVVDSKKAQRRKQNPPDGVDICYLCFEEGHRSPTCRFHVCKDDSQFQRYALCNYAKLKLRQREFIDNAGQMPQMLINHEPSLNVERLKVDADQANAGALRIHRKGGPPSKESKTLTFETIVESTKN